MARTILTMLLAAFGWVAGFCQGMAALPVFGHPNTAAVAGACDDAFAVAAQPGALPEGGRAMAGLRALRLPVEGAPTVAQAAAVMPLGPGCLSVQGWHAGRQGFRESLLRVGYGARLSEGFAMGVGFGLGRMRIPAYASPLRLQAEWGAVHRVGGGLRLALRLRASPPLRSAGSTVVRQMPVATAFGIGYRLSEQAALAAEVVKEMGGLATLTPVVYYRPVPALALRVGVRTDGGGLSASLAWRPGRYGFELGGRQTGPLGWCGDLCLDWRQGEEDRP